MQCLVKITVSFMFWFSLTAFAFVGLVATVIKAIANKCLRDAALVGALELGRATLKSL